MSRITIIRTETPWPMLDKMLDQLRLFLFGIIDGFTNDDRKRWRRLWKRIMELESGELLVVDFQQPRSTPFHRRHMKIEQTIFDAQERFGNFKSFRDWLKIGAGHCEWVPGPKGAIVPIPKSIDYASLDDDEFRTFHDETVKFLRESHAQKVLWPHLAESQRAEMMEGVLQGFGE